MRDILLKIIEALQEFIPPEPTPEPTPEAETDSREVVDPFEEAPIEIPVAKKRSVKK